MKMKIMWTIVFIQAAAAVFMLKILPDSIPLHYNFAGETDRWGSKYEGQLVFLALTAVTAVIFQVIVNNLRKKLDNTEDGNEKTAVSSVISATEISAVCVTLTFALMYAFSVYSALKVSFIDVTAVLTDIYGFECAVTGTVLAVIGNIMPKIKRNGLIGFRTEKTLSDDEIWRRANRFSGKALVIAGIVSAAAGILIGGYASFAVLLSAITAAVTVSLIYVTKL